MFQLAQGAAAETSGGLLICLPRCLGLGRTGDTTSLRKEQAAAYCKDIGRWRATRPESSASWRKGTGTIVMWPREIQTAVCLLLPGELAKHAASESTKETQ